MIKLFIFDQGGVLCRDFDVGPEAAKRLGIDVKDFRRLIAPDIMAFMRGELGSGEFWSRFGARSGLSVAEDYWATLFRPSLDAATVGVVEELRAGCRKRGSGRVVGGTNTIGPHYAIHKAGGQYDCLDAVYASHLMGAAKPEPGFWLSILEAEGVTPAEAFFTDDFPENVEAAARLGINARLYRDAAGLRADLEGLGAL
jgi:putative hydrolase of the HAD superfamily